MLLIRAEGVLFLRKTMTTRIRNIWHKFKKWLRYRPEKKYFRG